MASACLPILGNWPALQTFRTLRLYDIEKLGLLSKVLPFNGLADAGRKQNGRTPVLSSKRLLFRLYDPTIPPLFTSSSGIRGSAEQITNIMYLLEKRRQVNPKNSRTFPIASQ